MNRGHIDTRLRINFFFKSSLIPFSTLPRGTLFCFEIKKSKKKKQERYGVKNTFSHFNDFLASLPLLLGNPTYKTTV